MTDTDRFKLLHGPYATPRFRIGSVRACEVRGEVVVCGLTDARISWPVAKRGRARSILVTGGLAKAIRLESNQAVAYWWGVSIQTARIWRRALDVGRIADGSRRLFQKNYVEVITPEVFARAIHAANTPEANA
jgi:hypothetical protein